MSDYLGHLLERSFAPAPEVRPQIPSLFEPKAAGDQTALRLETTDAAQEGSGENSGEKLAVNPENEMSSTSSQENADDRTTGKFAPVENKQVSVKKSVKTSSRSDDSIRKREKPSATPSSAQPIYQSNHQVTSTQLSPVQSPVVTEKSGSTAMEARPTSHADTPITGRSHSHSTRPASGVVVDFHIDDSERRYGDRRPPTNTQSLQPRATQVTSSALAPSRPAKPAAPQPLNATSSPAKNNGREQSSIVDNAPTPPSIHVTIGRVEIRAHTPPPVVARSAPRKEPAMSLENYLQRRAGGSS